MLWRLNFLVFFACVVLRNSYVLYYICPMHTLFTVFVYASLAIAPQLNQKNVWIWVKWVARSGSWGGGGDGQGRGLGRGA